MKIVMSPAEFFQFLETRGIVASVHEDGNFSMEKDHYDELVKPGITYDLIYHGCTSGRKINAIKGIREITRMGLAAAKHFCETGYGKIIKSYTSKNDADAAQKLAEMNYCITSIEEKI